MPTMQVMRFNDSAAAPALIPGDAPIPRPGSGQLLIRVRAAGVTPTELLWYQDQSGHEQAHGLGEQRPEFGTRGGMAGELLLRSCTQPTKRDFLSEQLRSGGA